MTQRFLDPKNDFVFKTLFASAPELLAALINTIRHDEPPITVVEILNPWIDPEELMGKFIVLDLLAEDDHHRLYDIEMQVRPAAAMTTLTSNRSSTFICSISNSSMPRTSPRRRAGVSNFATASNRTSG